MFNMTDCKIRAQKVTLNFITAAKDLKLVAGSDNSARSDDSARKKYFLPTSTYTPVTHE